MGARLQKKITKAILTTFLVLLIIFSFVFLYLLDSQTDALVGKSEAVLNILMERERPSLTNEIFEGRLRAINLRVQEILALESVLSVTVFNASGEVLAHAARLAGPPPKLSLLKPPYAATGLTEQGQWRGIPALNFEAAVSALGERIGFLRISYSLAVMESNKRLAIIAFTAILATTLILMLFVLNSMLSRGVRKPIERLRQAMTLIETQGPGTLVEIDSQDEIGDLAHAFNAMSTQLAGLINQIKSESDQRRQAQGSLVRSHRIAQTLIDTTTDTMLMVDLQNKVVAINKSAAHYLGGSVAEFLGKDIRKVLPPELGEEFTSWSQEAASSGRQLRQEKAFRGRVFDFHFYPVRGEDGRTAYVANYGRDITEIRNAERALSDRMKQLTALNTLSRALSADLSTQGTINSALEQLTATLSPEAALIFQRQGEDLRLSGSFPSMLGDKAAGHQKLHKVGECLCGQAAQGHQALYSLDINEDPRCTWLECKQSGLISAAALPLVVGEENLGVILIAYRTPHDLSQQADFLEAFSNEVAISLKNALLFEQLKVSEEQFSSAFWASPDSVSIRRRSDNTYVEVNKGFEKMTGWRRREVLGKAATDLGLWADSRQYDKTLQAVREKDRLDNLEFTFVTKSGEHRYGTLSLRSIRVGEQEMYLTIVRDISEQKKVVEELNKSRGMLDSIIKSIPDILYRVDPQGKITFINDAVIRYGYTPQELIGMDVMELIHPHDRAEVERRLKERRTGKRKTKDLTVRVVGKQPGGHLLEARSTDIAGTYTMLLDAEGLYEPLENEQKKYIGTQGIARDITQLKNLESQLRQAQKMEAIGTLAGGIAHDFNNILSAVIGYAELSRIKAQDNADAVKSIDEVLKAGLRARDLISQILTFSRQAEVQKIPQDPAPIIKETLKFLRASIPATVEIISHIPAGLGEVLGDATQIHQFVLNICSNAAHAMRHGGGRLRVSLSKKEIRSDEAPPYTDLGPGPYFELDLIDTGEGIPSHVKDRIFDPFFTTKERGEGTGLGLSTVHGIVKDMGGQISVYSETGEGTTFKVLLPMCEGRENAEQEPLKPAMAFGTERLMIIDDEEALASLTAEMLQKVGYKAEYFTDPNQALTYFKRMAHEVDLIITDKTMPKITGLELGARFRALKPTIPIILMTGFNEGLSQEKIKEMGFKALIMKPFILSELGEKIRYVLDGKADS